MRLRAILLSLALCVFCVFLFACTRFAVEFEAVPTENGEQEITITRVTSWGGLLVGRKDSFIIEKTQENGKATFWVERNTEEKAGEQYKALNRLVELIETLTLAKINSEDTAP